MHGVQKQHIVLFLESLVVLKDYKMLHIHNLYCLPCIIKDNEMGSVVPCVGNITHAFEILVRYPERKKPFWRPRNRWGLKK
jgi:hypothetical protein